MNLIKSTNFMVLSFAFVLAITLLVTDWIEAQSLNTTSSEDTNDTRVIWNMKDRTITLVNTTSNESKIIGNVTATAGNMITNESLSNNNITENAENSTTDLNLTDKFKELQGQ